MFRGLIASLPQTDTSRLLRSSAWSMIAAIAARAASLIAMIVTANYLNRSTFGMLGMIQTTVFMSGVFIGTGSGIAAMKLLPELRKRDPMSAARVIRDCLTMTMAISCVFAILLAFAAGWIANHVLEQQAIVQPLRLAALLLPLTALNMAQNGVLAGLEAFRKTAWANLLCGLISLPILLLAASSGQLPIVVVALVVAMLMNCVWFQFAIRSVAQQQGIVRPRCSTGDTKLGLDRRLVELALPAILFSMLTAPTDWACFAILARSEGGFEQLGIFNAANQWFNVGRFIVQSLTVPLIPILASLGVDARSNSSRLRGVLLQSLLLNIVAAMPVVLAGVALSSWIMSWYGPGYGNEGMTLTLLLGCAALFAIKMPVLRALHAAGHIWLTFLLNVSCSVTYITGAVLLVSNGSRGLATARLIGYAVYAALTLTIGFAILGGDGSRWVNGSPGANVLDRPGEGDGSSLPAAA